MPGFRGRRRTETVAGGGSKAMGGGVAGQVGVALQSLHRGRAMGAGGGLCEVVEVLCEFEKVRAIVGVVGMCATGSRR